VITSENSLVCRFLGLQHGNGGGGVESRPGAMCTTKVFFFVYTSEGEMKRKTRVHCPATSGQIFSNIPKYFGASSSEGTDKRSWTGGRIRYSGIDMAPKSLSCIVYPELFIACSGRSSRFGTSSWSFWQHPIAFLFGCRDLMNHGLVSIMSLSSRSAMSHRRENPGIPTCCLSRGPPFRILVLGRPSHCFIKAA